MHILSRAHSSAGYPLANYMLIEIDDAAAARLLNLYKEAERLAAAHSDPLRIEFFDYGCDAMEDLPAELEELEDALCDTGYVVLDAPFELTDEQRKRRGFSLVQVECDPDIPSLCGFRWEFGVKHANYSVESERIPVALVEKIVQPD